MRAQIIIMLYSHICPSCGETTESRLIVVASVVNICCGSCLSHLRYDHVSNLPSVDVIRRSIWELAAGDLWLIERAKTEIGFRVMNTYICFQLQQYKLYETLVFKKMAFKKEKESQAAKAIA
jgi:hypothetical protein